MGRSSASAARKVTRSSVCSRACWVPGRPAWGSRSKYPMATHPGQPLTLPTAPASARQWHSKSCASSGCFLQNNSRLSLRLDRSSRSKITAVSLPVNRARYLGSPIQIRINISPYAELYCHRAHREKQRKNSNASVLSPGTAATATLAPRSVRHPAGERPCIAAKWEGRRVASLRNIG